MTKTNKDINLTINVSINGLSLDEDKSPLTGYPCFSSERESSLDPIIIKCQKKGSSEESVPLSRKESCCTPSVSCCEQSSNDSSFCGYPASCSSERESSHPGAIVLLEMIQPQMDKCEALIDEIRSRDETIDLYGIEEEMTMVKFVVSTKTPLTLNAFVMALKVVRTVKNILKGMINELDVSNEEELSEETKAVHPEMTEE